MPNYNFDGETDTESYGSWDETDDETENDSIYDPEEESLTKYKQVL
jgi:hypothetical protein